MESPQLEPVPQPQTRLDPGSAPEPILKPEPEFVQVDRGLTSESIPEVSKPPPTEPTAKTPAATQPLRRITRCVPLGSLNLDSVDWRKVDRYLDVTKSALLFGGRVLLVEGIAEALLLPVIARKHVLRNRRDALWRFRSAVFVPIDGVDFKPYVRLLLTAVSEVRIADRVVVITDGDGGKIKEGQTLPGEKRKNELDTIAAELKAANIFDVFINTYSLESELVRAGNVDLLKSAYLELHPKSETKWQQAIAKEGDAQALAIQSLFESTRKGDFAQILAEKINEGQAFKTPDYLTAAIEALVQ